MIPIRRIGLGWLGLLLASTFQFAAISGLAYGVENAGLAYAKGNYKYLSWSAPKTSLFLFKAILSGLSYGNQPR